MRDKIITIRGFFRSYTAEWKRMTIGLLDNETEKFTYDILHNINYGHSPLNREKGEFYVKIGPKSEFYSGPFKCSVGDLVDKRIEMVVAIHYYNFVPTGQTEKVNGWNLILVSCKIA
jgi:hypothetical protein